MDTQMLFALFLIALIDWSCEDKEVTKASVKWIISFMGLERLWVYHLGPLAWWIVEIWKRGAI